MRTTAEGKIGDMQYPVAIGLSLHMVLHRKPVQHYKQGIGHVVVYHLPSYGSTPQMAGRSALVA